MWRNAEMNMSGKQSTNGSQVVIDIPSEETIIEARGSCSRGSEFSASKSVQDGFPTPEISRSSQNL